MKRVLATLIAALVLAAASPAAPAAAADVSQPGLACADIALDGGQSFYAVLASHEAVLSIQIPTVKPLCKGATLTVYFTSDATATTIIYSIDSASYPSSFSACTPPVAGQGCLTFTKNYGSTDTSSSTAPAKLYIYLQTSHGQKVIDRAPNTNAVGFDLCDLDAITPDYDSTGGVIPECSPPGGNYYE